LIFWKKSNLTGSNQFDFLEEIGLDQVNFVTLNIFFDLSIYKTILNFTCKWTSAQKSRLVLEYKSLIKTVLGLGLEKLKLV
jgi:hypothetical protein